MFGTQTSINVIIDVLACIQTTEKPYEAIDYFALQVGRLNEDLRSIHPEYLNPLFERASIIFNQNAGVGMKLYGALQVCLISPTRNCFSD